MKLKLDKTTKELRKKYQTAHQRTLQAQERESNLLKQLREVCPHPNGFIAEIPEGAEGLIRGYLPPFRICEVCGYSEEYTNRGYNKLKNKKTYPMSRYEISEFPLKN